MNKRQGQRLLLGEVRPHIYAAFAFSVAINLLFLVTPLYMLQVYDRVLTTGSLATLSLLTGISVFLLVIYLFADTGRRRILARAGDKLSKTYAEPALKTGLGRADAPPTETVQALAGLNQLHQALHQGLPAVLFDLPFVPIFLALLFFVHPLLGFLGVGGAFTLIILAVLQQRLAKHPLAEARDAERAAQNELNQLIRQRGALVGMGMSGRAASRWFDLRAKADAGFLRAGVPSTVLGSATRSLRMVLQIAILASGAYLATESLISPGAIIASSIILGRGLAPIDQAVNSWRALTGIRSSLNDVARWMTSEESLSHTDDATPMPRPEATLCFEELEVGIPGQETALLAPLDHAFGEGRIIALLGRAGSGKTTLLQTIAGVWPSSSGAVRLGARDLARWPVEDRGRYVGYLPQHIELLRGSVFQNIARFTDADPETVIAAAQRVGCHALILGLPDGYDTEIGEGGIHLSAGQRQAIGLARAFFGNPPLILLDEPTAHLDADLASQFMELFVQASKRPFDERPFTAVIATHDLRLLNTADDIMAVADRKIGIMERAAYLEKISELRRKRAQRAQAQTDAGGVGDQPLEKRVTDGKD